MTSEEKQKQEFNSFRNKSWHFVHGYFSRLLYTKRWCWRRGTIAYILANKGTDVIDCGVPVLSMHAPYEVTSKYDIYSAYKTYEAFWKE